MTEPIEMRCVACQTTGCLGEIKWDTYFKWSDHVRAAVKQVIDMCRVTKKRNFIVYNLPNPM